MKVGLMSAFALAGLLFFGTTAVAPVHAHGGGNWEPFTIKVVNDRARTRITEFQVMLADVIRRRSAAGNWPLAADAERRDELITAKEEVDEIIEHYINDGINVQLTTTLHSMPQAGRTVAASQALGAALALLEHSKRFEAAADFVDEFYSGGVVARLLELVDAQRDRMDLYALLVQAEE